MSVTDTSEKGLEALIVRELVASGYVQGHAADYNRDLALDVTQLLTFLRATQPKVVETLNLDAEGIQRTQFLHRLQGEISKRGVVDVLRNGLQHGPHRIELFYGTPSAGNEKARALYDQNRFTVTRQLRYSRDETQRALDLALFINGLPVFKIGRAHV